MKTIILFLPYGSVGGMERVAKTLYDFYKKQGFSVKGVKIIGLENDIISFGQDEIVLSHKDFVAYSAVGRLFFYLKIPGMIKRIIRENKADYTISFGDMANCFSALSRTKETKIAGIHNFKSKEASAKNLLNAFFKWGYRNLYQRFEKVVCISPGVKEDLLMNLKYPFNNLKVIYNPHDIATIEKMAEEEIEDKNEKQIFERNVILFLGRMSPAKAPWHLVNALQSMRQEEVALVFIGDGAEEVMALLKKQIVHYKLEGRVFFLGRKSNPYKYLAKSKILALTSIFEGTPNVIVEAIALSVPVVSSNCTPGINDLMSLKPEDPKEVLHFTEAGLITPDFKNKELPSPDNLKISGEELNYAKALDYCFENYEIILSRLKDNQEALLKKFDMAQVATEYLKKKVVE